MSAAFTRGPWLVHDTLDGPVTNTDVRDGATNRWVARCGPMHGRPHVTESEANARLIAAAPELYEALSDIMENPQFQTAIGGNPNMVDRLMDRARVALAKARGEA